MAIKEGLPPLVSGGLRQVEAGLVDILGPWHASSSLPFPLCFLFFLSAWSLWPHFPQQKEEPPAEQGAKYSAGDWQAHPASTRAMIRRHSHQGGKPACEQRWRRPDLCSYRIRSCW